MSGIRVEIKGMDRAIDAFRKMPGRFDALARQAMKASVRDVAEEARARHRFVSRTGALERSVEHDLTSDRPLVGMVSVGGSGAPYARFVHDGTAAHEIRPRRRRMLRWASGGGEQFRYARKVRHPGTRPDPFLREALEAKKDAVARYFERAMKKLAKEAGG